MLSERQHGGRCLAVNTGCTRERAARGSTSGNQLPYDYPARPLTLGLGHPTSDHSAHRPGGGSTVAFRSTPGWCAIEVWERVLWQWVVCMDDYGNLQTPGQPAARRDL